MVIKEWFCADHGEFEGSHPICPHLGCDSHDVIREMRTAPAVHSGVARRTDAGLRKSSEMYGMDLKSAKEGETSKANNRAAEMIWGLETAQKKLGAPLMHNPATYMVKEDSGETKTWVDRGGMQTLVSEAGMPKNVVPKAEITGHLGEKKSS